MSDERFELEHGDLMRRLAVSRGEHPSADELLDWVEGSLGEEASAAVEDHVALCSSCAEAVELARGSDAELDDVTWRQAAGRLDERPSPWSTWEEPPRRSRPPAWLLPAAAVVLAAVVLMYRPSGDTTPPPEISTTRDAAAELLSPRGTVAHLEELRWRAIPAPVRYRVEIEHAGELVWQHSTAEARLPVTPQLHEALRSGEAYRWRIVALDGEGVAVFRSDWVDFEIRSDP